MIIYLWIFFVINHYLLSFSAVLFRPHVTFFSEFRNRKRNYMHFIKITIAEPKLSHMYLPNPNSFIISVVNIFSFFFEKSYICIHYLEWIIIIFVSSDFFSSNTCNENFLINNFPFKEFRRLKSKYMFSLKITDNYNGK